MSECVVTTTSAPPAFAAARVEELCVTRQSSAALSRIKAIAAAATVVEWQLSLVGGVEGRTPHAAGRPGKDSRRLHHVPAQRSRQGSEHLHHITRESRKLTTQTSLLQLLNHYPTCVSFHVSILLWSHVSSCSPRVIGLVPPRTVVHERELP